MRTELPQLLPPPLLHQRWLSVRSAGRRR